MASSETAARTMPHNTLAEETVLSAILTDPENTVDRCVERLTPGHFYVRGNRIIYEACLAMREKGELIETNSVVSRLKDAGRLEEVGGVFRVNQIATAFVTAANVDYYLGLLHEKHQLRRVIEASTRFIQMAHERQDAVPEVMDEVEKDLLALCEEDAKQERSFLDITEKMIAKVQDMCESRGKPTGLSWGFREMNTFTFGLKGSEMIVIAARPGIGKTALALNVAERIAVDDGKPIGFMSLEMSAEALALRIACSRSRVNSRSFYTNDRVPDGVLREFIRAAKSIESAPIHIIEASMISISQLRSSARRLRARHKIEALFVDYLQLVQASGLVGRNDSREREVAQVSAGLKSLAMELDIPVVVLSQLNREGGKREGGPQLVDLRESGAIEQDADVVCLLSRKEMKEDVRPGEPVIAEVYVAKNRNGPVGGFKLTFFPEFTRFEDYRDADLNPA
jgi:replicative DNA helicase